MSAVGFRTSVGAGEQLIHGGRTYVFERWSDGGARLHEITIPDQATTLVAVYRDPTPPVPVAGAVAADDTAAPKSVSTGRSECTTFAG